MTAALLRHKDLINGRTLTLQPRIKTLPQSPDLCRAATHSDTDLGAEGSEASQAAEGGGRKNVRGLLVLALLRSKAGLRQGGHDGFSVRGVLPRRIQQGMQLCDCHHGWLR